MSLNAIVVTKTRAALAPYSLREFGAVCKRTVGVLQTHKNASGHDPEDLKFCGVPTLRDKVRLVETIPSKMSRGDYSNS